jgi:hypothetical protein
MLVLHIAIVYIGVIVKLDTVLLQLLQKALSSLLEFVRTFSNLADDFVVGEVLQAVMDVRALMENLKQALSTFDEALLDGGVSLLVLGIGQWVLGNFVEHGLILLERVASSQREWFFLEKVFDALTFVRLLRILRLLKVLDPLVLSPQVLGNVSLQTLDLEGALKLRHLLEPV